jgi:hypothetical protein
LPAPTFDNAAIAAANVAGAPVAPMATLFVAVLPAMFSV